MDREGGNKEKLRKCIDESLSISSFSPHFLILSPIPAHFLILPPFFHSPAVRLSQVV